MQSQAAKIDPKHARRRKEQANNNTRAKSPKRRGVFRTRSLDQEGMEKYKGASRGFPFSFSPTKQRSPVKRKGLFGLRQTKEHGKAGHKSTAEKLRVPDISGQVSGRVFVVFSSAKLAKCPSCSQLTDYSIDLDCSRIPNQQTIINPNHRRPQSIANPNEAIEKACRLVQVVLRPKKEVKIQVVLRRKKQMKVQPFRRDLPHEKESSW
mmetsp:Transcript_21965/g.50601  ORF Transcript_21965/g.50601 Transcript_21965/m.50601 type:complete len:208 (+) Transcript_21965:232-855(+)